MTKRWALLGLGLSWFGLWALGCFDFEQYEFSAESGASGSGGSSSAGAGGAQGGSTNTAGTSAGTSGSGGCSVVCSGSCVDGRCVACEVGAIECLNGTQYRQCSSQGVWSEVRACSGQACGADGCQGICEPKRTRCSTNNTSVQTCSDQGQWGQPAACASGCSGTSCLGECTTGEKGCFDEDEAQTCNASGQWQTTQCDIVCNTESGSCAECDASSSRCDPSSPLQRQFCDDGEWQSLNVCPYHCQQDGDVSVCNGECTPGQSPRCKPNSSDVRQVCNADYQWEDEMTCTNVCSGFGECTGICKPQAGRFRCVDGNPERCDGSGTWQPQGPCPSGKTCTGVVGCI